MASLLQPVKYGSINTAYTSTNEFDDIMLTSEACKLKNNRTIDGQIITAGELFVK